MGTRIDSDAATGVAPIVYALYAAAAAGMVTLLVLWAVERWRAWHRGRRTDAEPAPEEDA